MGRRRRRRRRERGGERERERPLARDANLGSNYLDIVIRNFMTGQ